MVHGEERAESAKRVSNVLFGNDDFAGLNKNDIELLSRELPVHDYLGDILDVLVGSGMASSRTEARNFVNSGAVSINGSKISIDNSGVMEGINLLKRGKNSFILVKK
jgi:tyrosyl-tRNA synthetase